MRKLVCATVCMAAICAGAQDAAKAKEVVKEEKPPLSADGGFDIRFRYDWYDNLPNSGGAVSPAYVDYMRMRTRLWGKLYYEKDYGVFVRLGDEFREYRNYRPSHNYNKFADQLFVDNLYLDLNNLLWDRVNVRIGRQDMKYGAGRVIADGTPADGSRSAYFDAVKITVKATGKTKGDFFGTYTKPVDKFFTVGHADGSEYNITSYDGAVGGEDKIDDMTEWGLGTYWTMNEIEDIPMEFYLIYKDESHWYKKGKVANTVIPGRQYGTAGIRVTPAITGDLKGDFEAAYQFGRTESDSRSNAKSQEINAFMLYGGLTYTFNELEAMKPYATLALLYLSGDDKHSAYDRSHGPAKGVTGWNPVYGRYTYLGELPVKMYGSSYRWSNLIYPHLEAGFSFKVFDRDNAVKVQTGPMFADKDDRSSAPADNDSLYRGWYTQASYECTILDKLYNDKRGSLKGRLQAEYMHYDNYYYNRGHANDRDGYFLRAELTLAF